MNRFDEMDMDLDVMYDDVRVDEKILGFVEEEGEEEVFSKFRNFGGFGLHDKNDKNEIKKQVLV